MNVTILEQHSRAIEAAAAIEWAEWPRPVIEGANVTRASPSGQYDNPADEDGKVI